MKTDDRFSGSIADSLSGSRLGESFLGFLLGKRSQSAIPSQEPSRKSTRPAGKVWLIGAGPGDPELLTLKALRVLQECSVWLVDDLVSPEILDLAPAHSQIIKVGKRGGCPSTSQDFILRLMARYATLGHTVARLKGGDPFIFGRGGEEMEWLNEHGIAVDSISGISAGLAVGSALGMPLTHRQLARGVTLVTAHTVDGSRPDWQALAKSGMTVVCYMGISQVQTLVDELRMAGFAPDLPVAVIQEVSCQGQRHLTTTLRHLATEVKQQQFSSPAVIVLGEVAAQQHRLAALLEHSTAVALGCVKGSADD